MPARRGGQQAAGERVGQSGEWMCETASGMPSALTWLPKAEGSGGPLTGDWMPFTDSRTSPSDRDILWGHDESRSFSLDDGGARRERERWREDHQGIGGLEGDRTHLLLAVWVGTNDPGFPVSQVRESLELLKRQDFAVELAEIAGHTHNYYGRSSDINKAAWAFLQSKRLEKDPQVPRLPGAAMTPEIAHLLEIIDRAYNRKSWHGTNLRGSIRGVTSQQASRRPARGRHNIWEIVVHAAYWNTPSGGGSRASLVARFRWMARTGSCATT